MREIKFRGRRLDGKGWVEGDLLHCCGKDAGRVFIKTFTGLFEVHPATVGQFTGLKDKNGKEICEGDKLRIRGDVTAVVVWRNQGFDILDTCAWTPTNKGCIDGLVYAPTKTIEVIGNIHDNPELFKAEHYE